MPVYNGEGYIINAVKSVLEQEFTDFELIMVDDGSVDKSSEICEDLVYHDIRLKYIYQDNQGALLARKNGVFSAKGEYILFIDCDDTIEPDALYKLYHSIKNMQPDVLLYNYNKQNNKGEKKKSERIFNTQKVYTGKEMMTLSICNFGGVNSLCTKVTKSEIVKKSFKRYNCRLSRAEDFLISLNFFRYAKDVMYIDEYLYNYYIDNTSSSMHNVKIEFFDEYEFVYTETVKIIKEYQLGDEAQKRITESILVKMMADYFFLYMQKDMGYVSFVNIGSFINKKIKSRFAVDKGTDLGTIWNICYCLFKNSKFNLLYVFFWGLKVGYMMKHIK